MPVSEIGSSVRECQVAEIFDDPACEALLAEYERECAIALIGRTGPRRDMYENLEATGLGQCFSVREDGQLVGFAFVLIAVVPHYSLSLANVESLFMTRAARSGLALMQAIEDYARLCECMVIIYTAPVNSRLARLLFLSSDLYTNTNHVFMRRLQ